MKRLLLTAVVTLVSFMGFAQKVTIDGITYRVHNNGNEAIVTRGAGIEEANILSNVSIKGRNYPVTSIKNMHSSLVLAAN